MMDKLMLLITMMTSLVAITTIYAVIPYLSRKTLSFGVSIPEKMFNDHNITTVRRKYRNLIILSGLLFTVLIVFVANSNYSSDTLSLLLGALILANIIANGIIYLSAHRSTRQLKSAGSWSKNAQNLITVNTNFRRRKAIINPLWFISYILIIAVTVTISLMLFDTIPDQIPMKYNAAGEVIKYAAKSYGSILYMPVVQLFMVFISLFAYYSISNSKLQINPVDPEKTYKQNIIFRRRWSVYVFLLGLLLLIMFAGIQFSILGFISHQIVLPGSIVFSAIILVGTVTLAVTTGQSGSRIKLGNNKETNLNSDVIVRDDDNHWKWGILYYNPQDPSLFVEKRFGIGWTLNFGRPMSWTILLGTLILIVALMLIGNQTK